MPFESKAQMRWMFREKPEMAKQWLKETKDVDSLPNRKHPKSKTRRRLTQRRAKRRIGR
jgi:hypothetical protein|tara:strand:+ start:770 stop:946 length:177 start_codon:yes stop_codon:yes gene_type:complete